MIGKFLVDRQVITAILDTGASASFIAGFGKAAIALQYKAKPSLAQVNTADNKKVTSYHSLCATVSPVQLPSVEINTELHILPDRENILGHEVVLGIDAIRDFGMMIYAPVDILIGTIKGVEIGRETQTINHNDNLLASTLKTNLFQDLVDQYADIFAETAKTYMRTQPMQIHLNADFSAKARLRPQSKEDLLEIDRQVQQNLANDIIEPSQSPFSANVHLVPKKNGQKRMVVDFRFRNNITIKDHYPLPQISTMFLALRDATCFAAPDCTEGFLQIPIDERHRHCTAFITAKGSYQFKRTPFGFTNSPATFQRSMNEVFLNGLYTKCVIYIDDILVFGRTEEDLLENLRWVFDMCRLKNVKLKQS